MGGAEAGTEEPAMGGTQEPAAASEGEERIPVAEERLRVGKVERERGGAEIRTHVEETPVDEEVSLRGERVEVERQPVDRPVEAGDRAFEERSIEMTERSEEPVVSKETRVVEEITVGKEATERTFRIQDVLRKTVVNVTTYGDLDDAQIRAEFEASGGEGDYGEYSSAARFGHAYGSHPELREVEFEEAEPSLRERYESEQGKGAFDRARDSIRTWWHRARTH
jgi:stress response protein YsnF